MNQNEINNVEDIEENIPEDEKEAEGLSPEPFCLKDHLQIEEFNEKIEQELEKKLDFLI